MSDLKTQLDMKGAKKVRGEAIASEESEQARRQRSSVILKTEAEELAM